MRPCSGLSPSIGNGSLLQGSTDQAMSQLQKDLPSFKQPVHQAEAHFLLGACSLRLEKWKDSIAQLKKANEIAPKWNKADETQWMLGQVYQEDDQVDVATATFESLIKEFPNSRFRQQAEYRLGQIAVGKEQYDRAIQYYDGILQSKGPPFPWNMYRTPKLCSDAAAEV